MTKWSRINNNESFMGSPDKRQNKSIYRLVEEPDMFKDISNDKKVIMNKYLPFSEPWFDWWGEIKLGKN